MLILVLVSELAPFRMVAILLAAPRIEPGCLDVPVRRRADPHGLVGRRDADGFDASDDGGIRDALAVLVVVAESGSSSLACVPRRGVADVPEAFFRDGSRHFDGAVQNLSVVAGLSEHGPVPRKHPGTEAPLLSKGMKIPVGSALRWTGAMCDGRSDYPD